MTDGVYLPLSLTLYIVQVSKVSCDRWTILALSLTLYIVQVS